MFRTNHFIKATKDYTTFENHIPSPYFRKNFVVDADTKAEVVIAAVGFYELYINGVRITKGYFAPYISNPEDIVYYDKYMVELKKGKNVIAVQLGNGFANNPGGYIWDFQDATFRSAPSFALILKYTDNSGKEIVIESGEDFKTAASPIIFDDYRFGEYYDANLEINGWNTCEFDDSAWNNAIPDSVKKGEMRLCEAEPIVATGEIKPVLITERNGKYIYDFGLNCTGVCRLTVKGEKGQKIELQHAEQLINGELDMVSVWFKRDYWERDKEIVHKDMYICKGEGIETYMPTFTYHGFRYVEVSGINREQATEDLLTYVVMNSDIKVCGGFATSDKTVNMLQEMTMRSNFSNFFYFPTDCPHREKNGWSADAGLSAEQMLLNLTVEKSFREWMRNICKAQREDGAIPGIVPTSGWGFEWGNGPGWDRVIVYLPYYSYVYRGDRQIVSESAETIIAYLRYIKSRTDERGLIAIGLGDWCHAGRDPEQPKAPLVVTDSIVSLDIASKAAFLFDEIGLDEYRDYALEIAQNYKKAVREHLVDFNTMTVSGACQTSQALALFYGVFEEGEKQAAFKRLLDFIDEASGHLDVGVLGGRVLFHTLSRFGYSDLALNMIIRPDFPSYANWIERGATTLWEMFSEEDICYSKNHHFWGDISAWFIKVLAGINYNPSGKNLKEVNICPCFVEKMNDASAYFESVYGRIEADWKRKGDKIVLNVNVPGDFDGRIILPKGFCFDDGLTNKKLSSGLFNIQKI